MTQPAIDLQGKAVLITGGSRGIGRAIAIRFLQAGASVGVVASRQETADAALVALKEAVPGCDERVAAWAADVSDAEAVGATVKAFSERFGGIDTLVNNAGITRDNLLLRIKDDDWDRVLDVNLKGAFLWSRAVARPMMKARKGSIINVSSIVGLTGNAGQANYAASKAGMLGLTRSVALELASRGVRVNAVCPGFVATEMTESLDDAVREEGAKRVPLGRFGEAEEIANVCLFLASDLAGYVTGSTVVVDGGLTLS